MLNLLNTGAGVSRETTLWHVPLAQIVDNPYQPRMVNDPDHVLALTASIVEMRPSLPNTLGLQQVPIGRLIMQDTGAPAGADMYEDSIDLANLIKNGEAYVELAFGHSRRLAFEALAHGPESIFPDLAGAVTLSVEYTPADYAAMPIHLVALSDEDMWRHAVTENGQRRDISAIEEAFAIQRATTELGMTIEEAGRTLNKSRSAASNLLRLLRLPEEVRKSVLSGQASEKAARTLLRLEPAPAELKHAWKSLLNKNLSTRELETDIDRRILNFKPVPDEPTKMRQYSWRDALQMFQPPWDMRWAPDGKKIKGACAGCALRVVFGDEKAPRCLDKDCYEAKRERWPKVEQERQSAIVRPQLDDLWGGNTLVDALTEDGRRQVPILDSKPDQVMWFDCSDAATKALLDDGICGGHCKCFAVAYHRNLLGPEKHWRPLAMDAPNMFYCCTDVACFRDKLAPYRATADAQWQAEREAKEATRMATDAAYRERMEQAERDRAEREQKIAESQERARGLVDRAITAVGGLEVLWSNHAFMAMVAVAVENQHFGYGYDRNVVHAMERPLAELQAKAAWILLTNQSYSGSQVELATVQANCNRIAPPPAGPLPGEQPPTTNYADGWDDDDSALWTEIEEIGEVSIEHIRTFPLLTKRVILRLIEHCDDRDDRAELWRMHNSL